MKEIFKRIWEMALKYQDKRDDTGHAETVLKYARQLVEMEHDTPDIDEDVIIPAAILHDIGWSQLPVEQRLSIFDAKTSPEEKLSARLQHQNAGVRLAKIILNQLEYPPELTIEIVEIISQHDTREGFISINDGLVRDADKLWRFSGTGFAANIARTGNGADYHYKELEDSIDRPGYFYSENARKIARQELISIRKPV